MSMAASMASAQSVGQIFEVDGICYQITSSTKPYTVAVSDDGSIKYTGSVTIPETVSYNGKVYSVTSIGDFAFSGCIHLTSATIPNSVIYIEEGAFENCYGLTSITIPNSVIYIGGFAFYGCNHLTSITIPSSVTAIGEYTFSGCSGLTSVTIPNSVTSIGNFAFTNCPLTRIYSYAEYPPSCGTDVFSVVKKNCKLYVLPESVGLYKTNQDWKEFNILPMDEVALSVREVGTEKGIQEYYDLQGRRRAKRQHGLNIIRRSDGTTRQLLVK